MASKTLSDHVRTGLLLACQVCAWHPCAQADPMPVHHLQGTLHGFLELHAETVELMTSGTAQVVHGDRVTTETIFPFQRWFH